MRRPERLIRLTQRLVESPNKDLSLSELATECDSAKSSLSEDVAMIRDLLERQCAGTIATTPGAGGGIRYLPTVSGHHRAQFLGDMAERLSHPARVLPGGFLHMSDVLGDPDVLDMAGRLFAQAYQGLDVNAVVTVETKGIPLAVATAHYLHAPVIVVRREHRVTDGPALSVHYLSGSERRIQTMSISTRAMPARARVLIVDDFMRAGATVRAVKNLLAEFQAQVVGTAVFMATLEPSRKLVEDYLSLLFVRQLQEGEPPRIEILQDVSPSASSEATRSLPEEESL